MIYFIQVDGATDRVKIGKAHDVTRRMYELSRYPSSAWRDQADYIAGGPLVLRAQCEGYSEVEAALHRMLAPHRMWGEWFDATAPMVADLVAFVVARGEQALAAVVPDAHHADRVKACTHTSIRAMHPTGVCLLCDPTHEIIGPPKAPEYLTSDSAVQARLMSGLGAATSAGIDRDAADAAALAEEFAEYLRKAEGEYARRDLAEFFRQAVRSGNVHGLRKVQWSPHLDATCYHVQTLLEGWLVTQGLGTDEMIGKQRALWVLHYGAESPEVTAETWLREPLVQNAIENLCPGTLKSTIAMVIANAWIWLHAPWFQFGASSWLEANVNRDSDAAKDLCKSEWYRSTFEIEWHVRSDQDSKILWSNTAGGFRLSKPIRSGFTGQHVHGIFVDDPDDADAVWQETNRETVHSKFTNAMENRVVDEITCIRFILQQRVHLEDLTSYLLAVKVWSVKDRKGWAWVVIPLRYGRAPKDAPRVTAFGWSDWRHEPDEVMHPARFTLSVIADKLKTLQEFGFAAQYDQNPQTESGGMYVRNKVMWWRFDDEDPIKARPRPRGVPDRIESPAHVLKRGRLGRPEGLDDIIISIDATFGSTKKTASSVGVTVYGKHEERRFVLEDRTRVMGVQEQYDVIIETVAEWAPSARAIIVELKALGDAVVNELTKMLTSGKYNGKPIKGLDGKAPQIVVEGITVGAEAGKLIRARGASPTWNSSLTFLHDGAEWVYPRIDDSGKTLDDGYFNEIVMCPNGRKMDRVDTYSQAISYWRDNGEDERRARAMNSL